jgi:hypothetical protein
MDGSNVEVKGLYALSLSVKLRGQKRSYVCVGPQFRHLADHSIDISKTNEIPLVFYNIRIMDSDRVHPHHFIKLPIPFNELECYIYC